ncbi:MULTISPECIES: hypothetical protein [Sphingobacterium]|uniref:hypothetical protein n=1 Tax=Sphingobacterium TaxID=28453 RepID=UPI00257CE2CF|nr:MULTISPECIES: hypothetical protein [Sphingobacterium]
MKKEFTFEIESLLSGNENPKGPIEQVLFAMRHAKYIGKIACSNIARITFSYPNMNAAIPGGSPIDETLLIRYEDFGQTQLHLCVRSGKDSLRVASGYFPTEEINIYSEYQHALLLCKLSENQIKDILKFTWSNMDLIQPKPFPI